MEEKKGACREEDVGQPTENHSALATQQRRMTAPFGLCRNECLYTTSPCWMNRTDGEETQIACF